MATFKKATLILANLLSWITGFALICFGIMIMTILSFLWGFMMSVAGLILLPPFRRVFGNQMRKLGQFGVVISSAFMFACSLTGIYYVVLAEPIEKYLDPITSIEFDASGPDMEALETLKKQQEVK